MNYLDTELKIEKKLWQKPEAFREFDDKAIQVSYADFFIDKYFGAVYLMVLKIVGIQDEAEYITSLSFDQIFTPKDKIKSNGNSKTKLFKTATDNSIDFLSITNHIHMIEEGDQNDGMFSGNSEVSEIIPIDEIDLDLLDQIIQELKPVYKNVLRLKYIKKYSLEEIAGNLGVSVGSVKSKLFHSQKMVNDIILKRNKTDVSVV